MTTDNPSACMSLFENRFAERLAELARELEAGSLRAELATEELRRAIVRDGSESPDNVSAASRLRMGSWIDRATDATCFGAVTGSADAAVSIAEIFHRVVETDDVADRICEAYPQLVREDAAAALRFCALVLLSLQRERRPCMDEAGAADEDTATA